MGSACTCTSRKHGHPGKCGKPVIGDGDFCTECKAQMEIDHATQDVPNLTPTDTPQGKKF